MSIIAIAAFVLLVAADQVSKYMAIKYLAPIGTMTIIENLFQLTFVKNSGAAFGILQGGRPVFLILIPIILIGIIIYYLRLPKGKVYTFVRLALVLITSGAVGNYIDRVRLGYVVDFFEFGFIRFPVFNVADIYVVAGTGLLAVLMIFFIKDETA